MQNKIQYLCDLINFMGLPPVLSFKRLAVIVFEKFNNLGVMSPSFSQELSEYLNFHTSDNWPDVTIPPKKYISSKLLVEKACNETFILLH